MVQFYDAAVVANIPPEADHAALYGDGKYRVSGTQVPAHIKYRRWITVAGYDHCGIADFEEGNEIFSNPTALRTWVAARHRNDLGIPIVYTDRANAAEAAKRVTGMAVLYWITTIDPELPPAEQLPWTAEALSANLASGDNGTVTPVVIAPRRIWANQFQTVTGKYDKSDLFLGWWA